MLSVPHTLSLRNPIPKPVDFSRTYRGRDGWDRVMEYRQVANYCADHPRQGSSAVANALDLPRSRIRTWVDEGGAPDPVHGLRTAYDREWFVQEIDQNRRRALAVCVSWIFAGGSISSDVYTPRFSVQSQSERERIAEAVSELDLEMRWIDREAGGQGVEAEPAEDASVFGRVLVAAGAPVEDVDCYPSWIKEEPLGIRHAAAAAYVECRGQLAGNGKLVQVREETRPDEHLEAVGELLVDVAGNGSYSVGSKNLRLNREATDALLDAIEIEL